MPRSRTIALPLLLATVLVGSVTPASLARDDGSTSAGVNADRVDGKDAVSATGKKKARADKLVATDTKGYLPSNILRPLWGLIQGLPAVLADGQVSWNELVGIPADLSDGQVGWGEVGNKPTGFADGTDDAGVTGIRVTRIVELANFPVGTTTGIVQAICPAGSVVVGGGFSYFGNVTVVFSFDLEDGSGWKVGVGKPSGENAAVYSIAKCLSVEPSGSFTTAKKGVKVATKLHRRGK